MKYLKFVRWSSIAKVFLLTIVVVIFVVLIGSTFIVGFETGWRAASGEYENYLASLFNKVSSTEIDLEEEPTPTPVQIVKKEVVVKTPLNIEWGGPELWGKVNEARVDNGVNPLNQRDELCTIAAIRLNEILVLGQLDNHEGFSDMPERREDLKWIFEKYVIAEFLVSGAETAQEAVDLWYNTLGHKKLITGGEYAYGCIYAQNGFAVAIAAY